jgi:hypothetical protein
MQLNLLLLSTVIALSGLCSAQEAATEPDNGYLSDGVYVSRFFAFSYKIPQGLIPQGGRPTEHPIDPSKPSAKHFSLLMAAKLTTPYQNVAIQAESAARFKDGADYLEKLAPVHARVGVTELNSPEKKNIAGENFFRQDFYSAKGSFYQTHVCSVFKGYVLDFVLSASNRADIEQLFNSLSAVQFDAKPQ